MGVGLCVTAMRRSDDALVCRPLPSTGMTPLPRYYGPIRLPATRTPGWGLPCLRRPRPTDRAGGGISRVPSAPRPCMPTAEAPVDAVPLSPERAAAAAFPAVANGSASTVEGISGRARQRRACPVQSRVHCIFRPTGFLSTLRPGRYRTRRKTRPQQGGGSPHCRWDFPPTHRRAGHPLENADLARRIPRPLSVLACGAPGALSGRWWALPGSARFPSLRADG